jgi:hypothetical protein
VNDLNLAKIHHVLGDTFLRRKKKKKFLKKKKGVTLNKNKTFARLRLDFEHAAPDCLV